MTPRELISDLRSRINPAYAHCLGTESYERRICADALESQADRLEVLEREHAEFLERWHDERRKREALELERAGDTPMARLYGCCADDRGQE